MDINRVKTGEVKRLSLVKEPANESHICSASFCSIDGNTITAVVLSKDQMIYRGGEQERFFYFNEDSVETTAHKFLEQVQNNNLSLNHEPFLNDNLSLQESWVSEGVWRVKLSINDEDIMSQIKVGELQGISLEGVFIEETVLEITEDEEKFMQDAQSLDIKTKLEIFGEYNINE